MGAKNSKAEVGGKEGVAGGGESSDCVDRTATLPASFKQKEVEVGGKTETLPRNLNRSTSFTNSCRNWAKKKGLVKDKEKDSSKTETENDTIKENGTGVETKKENGTSNETKPPPVVGKIAQKKARAQFFEDMYNSSGISVSSSMTPEKPKRLGDMNLPSPRFGPGSPQLEGKVEGQVETVVKKIEEKEKLNKSMDSEVISLNRSFEEASMSKEVEVEESAVKELLVETPPALQDSDKPEKLAEFIPENIQETVKEVEEVKEDRNILEEVKENLEEAAKSEISEVPAEQRHVEEEVKQDLVEAAQSGEEEVKGLLKVQEILERSSEQDPLDETLPSNARLVQDPVAAETVTEESDEEDTKDEVEEIGGVNEVSDIEAAAAEPSSLESVGSNEEEETKAVENGENGGGENVINTGGESSEEGEASTDEGYDDEKNGGGAEGLMKALKKEDNTALDGEKPSESVEDD